MINTSGRLARLRTAVGLSMSVHTQSAAFSSDAAPRLAAHGRRGTKRSKHFTQFLTCRTTPQKIQGSTHTAKSSYPSRFRKHPQLHLAAELARHPAAPGLLFTAAAVHGFSAVSKVRLCGTCFRDVMIRDTCRFCVAFRL